MAVRTLLAIHPSGRIHEISHKQEGFNKCKFSRRSQIRHSTEQYYAAAIGGI